MRRRTFLAAAGASLAALALGGCATPAGSPEVVVELGPPIDSFIARGRLALRQGERSDHLQFDWQHAPQRDSVLLLSPLGQGLAEIVRDAAGARMSRPNEAAIEAPDLATLAQNVFGTPLPLEELGHWLRGARGTVGSTAGWRVAVTEATPYRQRRLPRRLEASWGDVMLILIVDEWGEAD